MTQSVRQQSTLRTKSGRWVAMLLAHLAVKVKNCILALERDLII